MLKGVVVPETEKRPATEPQNGQMLSDSSVPSDLEDQRLYEESPGHQAGRRALPPVPQDTHFKEVPIFVDMRSHGVTPTSWSFRPQRATCPNCLKTEQTKVKHRPSCGTCCWCWALCLAGGLCLLGLCLCCQDAEHHCVHCNKVLGYRAVL